MAWYEKFLQISISSISNCFCRSTKGILASGIQIPEGDNGIEPRVGACPPEADLRKQRRVTFAKRTETEPWVQKQNT